MQSKQIFMRDAMYVINIGYNSWLIKRYNISFLWHDNLGYVAYRVFNNFNTIIKNK